MTSKSMRILLVHERYRNPGGEDEAVEADCKLLSEAGHHVIRWSLDNRVIDTWSYQAKLRLAWTTSWSRSSYRRMLELIREHSPHIVHFHNTLPLISPSAIRAAHNSSVPTVMTLHNYRLMCPVGTFLRQGRICEDCPNRSLLRGVVHGCYRGSRIQTGAVAAMLTIHRRLGTWTSCVDAYVAPTEFMRSKAAQAGLPAERIHVRSNSVRVQMEPPSSPQGYAVFIGRLSDEKGLSTLLAAARLMAGVTIKVLGAGPMEPSVRDATSSAGARLEYLGQTTHDQAIHVLRGASMLLFPSIWYETLPMTILEAFACGVPVVASRLGGRQEIVTDGETGYLFEAGDARDMANKVLSILGNPALRKAMSAASRLTFESRFSSERSYDRLMEIYIMAIDSASARQAAA